ncbi:hypothetical protein SYNPS1DRAFT_28679 [Syncephalis pseudoplumigaleata]|uniref:Lung seven transmembrane receptor-domain-containing protein n=1 Tax=Syncephalis pseudoplumigaleata TaxID=1712513 RepID=A0A4P9YZZ0_9FUNG|nr:hypothetical protein SYNPS1DRAFT_28679 [Syncephalis pseudoplumigaleata]|eukprot:RKP25588.1 hypothetical protein SYNPS1DRAFT_28679 [Syncephalis pseudoplumigaleata]
MPSLLLSSVLALVAIVLLWQPQPASAALILDWVTGFQITIPTAVWYTARKQYHSHLPVLDGRARLLRLGPDCTPLWPSSFSESQITTGWAIFNDTLVVVTFDDGEGHPLSTKCSSHMEIIRNIIATKKSRRIEAILLPSQNPVPGGPNERYCAHWSELPCYPPTTTRDNATGTDVVLAVGFYSPKRKHQLEGALANANHESIRATLNPERGPWLHALQSNAIQGFIYSFIAMSMLFLVYGAYRLFVFWRRHELTSTMANWIYALCMASLLLRGVGDLLVLSHAARAVLLGFSNLLTAIAESALLAFWAKVMLRRKRTLQLGHYAVALLGLVYGIATCVLYMAPKPTAWLVIAGWLASGSWSIGMLAMGALTRLLFFAAFLFFGVLFYRQRQRVAITWTTRETTLRLTQLSAVQSATHLIVAVMLLAGLALADLRRTPECATPLHLLSLLMHIAQNASIILLLRPPVEESPSREHFVSHGHTVTKHSGSSMQTPTTSRFYAKSDVYLPIRKNSSLSLSA